MNRSITPNYEAFNSGGGSLLGSKTPNCAHARGSFEKIGKLQYKMLGPCRKLALRLMCVMKKRVVFMGLYRRPRWQDPTYTINTGISGLLTKFCGLCKRPNLFANTAIGLARPIGNRVKKRLPSLTCCVIKRRCR